MSRVLFVRHCQSNGLPEPDDRLTDLGLVQASALAEHLRQYQVDRVVCSPYRRSQQSIEPFIDASGLLLEADSRLAERRVSPVRFEAEYARLSFLRKSYAEPDLRMPGGESAREALERGWSIMLELLRSEAELVIAVSHGQLLSQVLARIDPSFGFAGWTAMTNPDVFLVEAQTDGGVAFQRTWG